MSARLCEAVVWNNADTSWSSGTRFQTFCIKRRRRYSRMSAPRVNTRAPMNIRTYSSRAAVAYGANFASSSESLQPRICRRRARSGDSRFSEAETAISPPRLESPDGEPRDAGHAGSARDPKSTPFDCCRLGTETVTPRHASLPTVGWVVARAITHALVGLEPRKVEVEAHVQTGLPGFAIVGLVDRACQEAKHRVRSGVFSASLEWPLNRRITVNLAPAGLRKEGSGFDLPISLAVLAATRQGPPGRAGGEAA